MRSGLLGLTVALSISALAAANAAEDAPNGIAYPTGWQDWAVIATSYRTDNETIRVILGNDIAVAAARSGATNPWPDGTILGKVVWKALDLPNWELAKAPGAFVHVEFMFKDARKYAATTGWGWARWKGLDQTPYGEDADFAQECIACHVPVAERDNVFADPASLPRP
jgi:hypothetical protein